MKLITRDTDYAIRALLFLSKHKGGIVAVTELVKELKVPRPYLRKILQVLCKKGYVTSYKGKGGGFQLNRAPDQVYVLDVMKIFQGSFRLNECLLKKAACPDTRTCALKKKIDAIERYVIAQLKSITLKTLLG